MSRHMSQQLRLCPLSVLVLTPLVGLLLALSEGLFPRAALSQPRPASAMSAPERVLAVTGTGRQSIPTMLTQVSLGVVVEAATAESAQQ